MECFRKILRRSLLIVIVLGASYPLLLLAVGKIDPLTFGRVKVIFSRTAYAPAQPQSTELQPDKEQETAQEEPEAAETTETSSVVSVVLTASKESEPEGFCQVLQQLANRSCLTDSGGSGGGCRITTNCSDSPSGDASFFSPPASEAMLRASAGTRFVLFLRDPRDVLISACDVPAHAGCENLNLFLMQNIRPVSRSAELGYRIFTSMKRESPERAEIFYYEDFHRAASRSRLLSALAQFLGLSLAEPELRSLAEGGKEKRGDLHCELFAPELFGGVLDPCDGQGAAFGSGETMAGLVPSALAQDLPKEAQPRRRASRRTAVANMPKAARTFAIEYMSHLSVLRCPPALFRGPCRVDSTGDWFQHVAPSLETRGVIHTYVLPSSKDIESPRGPHQAFRLALCLGTGGVDHTRADLQRCPKVTGVRRVE